MTGKITILIMSILLIGCSHNNNTTMNDSEMIRLMVLDPGHFHASLVQKEMYPEIDMKVYVYAPEGMELNNYLQRIDSYNSREKSPTSWEVEVYRGADFLDKMLKDKPGNLIILAGNNNNKT